MHRIDPALLRETVDVVVVGCGGTGSAIAGGLPYLHQAMVALGHPGGLNVTLVDDDIVSPTNCVRQPFSESDVGLHKAIVLATRLNAFWGLSWNAWPHRISAQEPLHEHADVLITCVDTRASRRVLHRDAGHARYWLDIGNNAAGGQFVLGEPEEEDRESVRRLPTVAELYPEILDPKLDDDGLPACSAAEAVTRQEPFINQVLANHALALLARLFRWGRIDHHGGFVNLQTGVMRPIPTPAAPQLSAADLEEIAQLRATGAWEDAEIADSFGMYPEELPPRARPQQRRRAA